MRARGITPAQAMTPKTSTHLLRTGSIERADEGDGDDEVGEGKPVGAVGHEGVVAVGVDDAFVDAAEPGVEGGFAAGRGCRRRGRSG